MGGCWSRKTDSRRKTTHTRSYDWDEPDWEPEVCAVTVSLHTPPAETFVRRVPPAQPANRVYTVPKPTVASVPKPKPPAPVKEKLVPLYGEYKCGSCKNFWVSRLSWPNRYQQCRRCKSYARPKNQRELRPTDYTRGKDDVGSEHPQEFCEMCKQLGKHCGTYKSK
ncbi:uncharacterized protein LOC111358024 [Spodoptera litura]|uniref:Uncharacterized protein LOC111358024 n=1 Tax=Spodoptera litura TaxID=69820 RepID=A0A9J7ECU7_SPOLT|nr:uncharacterized protein LOC111358024 [Spodoptera litura]